MEPTPPPRPTVPRSPGPARARPRRRATGLLVAALLALTTVGCGGDDDGASGDPARDAATTTTEAPGATPTGAGLTEDEVQAMDDEQLAAETYLAGYPLVVTIRTLQRLGGLVGVNTLFWQTALSGPQSRTIVAPNRDTLYSIAVVDLRSEPLVLTLPEVTDRYYTYQLLDAWTDSFAYIGTRATGGRAGTWVIAPPGWEGEVPDGAEVVESPTPQMFLLGRYLVDDEADIADVLSIRDGSSLVPLSEATGTAPGPDLPPLGEAAGSPQGLPTDGAFFDELAVALAVNPPTTPAQQALFAAAEERLGLAPGEAAAAGDAQARDLLDAAAESGAARLTEEMAARQQGEGPWNVNLGIGTYGDDIALRAFVARVGWGANVPEEAVYPVARTDSDGRPLDGSRTYRITFPPGGLPPVDAFWSLSAYGGDMFFAEHPSGRYSIGDRSPELVTGDDGSVEIVLSHQDPGPGVGWLPVPEGPFVLMLRLYLPGEAIIDGTYEYPAIVADA